MSPLLKLTGFFIGDMPAMTNVLFTFGLCYFIPDGCCCSGIKLLLTPEVQSHGLNVRA